MYIFKQSIHLISLPKTPRYPPTQHIH